MDMNVFSGPLTGSNDVLESGGDINQSNLFSGTNPFTISFWVNANDYTNVQLFDKGYSWVCGK